MPQPKTIQSDPFSMVDHYAQKHRDEQQQLRPKKEIIPMTSDDDVGERVPSDKPMEHSIGKKPAKVRATFHVPSDLVQGIRDASYWSRMSIADIVERALKRELRRLEKEHNNGDQFQRRPAA